MFLINTWGMRRRGEQSALLTDGCRHTWELLSRSVGVSLWCSGLPDPYQTLFVSWALSWVPGCRDTQRIVIIPTFSRYKWIKWIFKLAVRIQKEDSPSSGRRWGVGEASSLSGIFQVEGTRIAFQGHDSGRWWSVWLCEVCECWDGCQGDAEGRVWKGCRPHWAFLPSLPKYPGLWVGRAWKSDALPWKYKLLQIFVLLQLFQAVIMNPFNVGVG